MLNNGVLSLCSLHLVQMEMDRLPLIKRAHRERMTVDALKEEINVLSRRATMMCAYLSKLSFCFYLVSAFIAHRTGLHYGSPGDRTGGTKLVMSTFLEDALQRLREKNQSSLTRCLISWPSRSVMDVLLLSFV